MSEAIAVRNVIKIDMHIVEKYDNISPYIKLVKSIIRDSERRMPEIISIEADKVEIASWQGAAFICSAWIPKEAVSKRILQCTKKENKRR